MAALITCPHRAANNPSELKRSTKRGSGGGPCLERRRATSHFGLRRALFTVLAAFCLGGPTSPAWAEVAGVYRQVIGDEADFGSGFHFLGRPNGSFTITWDYTIVTSTTPDTVQVSARVQGTLYLDRLSPGTAGLQIDYLDSAGNVLWSEPRSFCGPGGDANNARNQIRIDHRFVSRDLRRVAVTTRIGGAFMNPFTGDCFPVGGTEYEHSSSSDAPAIYTYSLFNNGTADLGDGPHVFGSPSVGALIRLRLTNDDRIEGSVAGVLYWDSFTAGTARAIIDFQDADGNSIIPPRTFDETGPNGGNALLSSNQTPVNLTLTSAHLFRIRITVGTVGNMGNAITRTIALGPSVGLGEGVPFSQSLPLRTAANYGLRWTVPDPEVWRSLDSMEIRLIDDQGEVLRLLWDETSNTFSVLNPHTGRFADPTEPGSRKRFETPWVTLLLEDTQVIGSGPAGPSVLLNLNLQFKPKASGRTFRVEAAAIDDSGNVQDFELSGTVTVSPR